MSNLSLNIRYEFWKNNLPKPKWEAAIIPAIGDGRQVRDLLLSREISLNETQLSKLSDLTHLSKEQLLRNTPLQELADKIFQLNLEYLLESNLPHGGKQEFAESIKLSPVTISRWLNGSRKPSKADQVRIMSFFSVDSEFNLESEAIFLSYEYLGVLEISEWLKQRSQEIDTRSLHLLFPAFRKLLE